MDTPVWTLHSHEEVESTNDLASTLPAWHAVKARRQHAGRGRYRRSWVSDEGGIWFSAVLPTPGNPVDWSILPLAAGWALRAAIASLGIEGLRLRWPNDLMVGRSKLAGILVERFCPATATIGIGINHTNQPESAHPELAGLTTRLVDLCVRLPSTDQVLASVLAYLGEAQGRIASGNTDAFLPELNKAWQNSQVVITLSQGQGELQGDFLGVDRTGNLLVLDDKGQRHCLSPLQVELLRDRPSPLEATTAQISQPHA